MVIENEKITVVPKKRTFQSVRGMRDILPQDEELWNTVALRCEQAARAYGFKRMAIPVLEETELFKRSVGQYSDIVRKEMFSFKTQGGEEVTLRPEFTAGIMRAYIEHGLMNQPKPIKVYEIGQCFRYERPQSGRLRQFHQFNPEIIGIAEPAADAEIIALAYAILRDLGLEVVMQVNSIGTPESRKKYIKHLKEYFQPKLRYLPKEDQERFKNNPLRLLDSKNKRCMEFVQEVPQIVDYLDDESRTHLMQLLEYLDEFDFPYVLNPRIVRGLDYYTKTVFEIWVKDDDGTSAMNALGGGGRYDGLLALLGGRETPAVGMALGLERIISKIREKNIVVSGEEQYDIFLAHLGDDASKKAFAVFETLRKKGYSITWNLSKKSLKQQLESANRLKVKLTLIIGQKEVSDSEILIKEMDMGAQESVPLSRLERELDKRLKDQKI